MKGGFRLTGGLDEVLDAHQRRGQLVESVAVKRITINSRSPQRDIHAKNSVQLLILVPSKSQEKGR